MTAPRSRAVCWRSGEIKVLPASRRLPDGALPIAVGAPRRLREVLTVNARHAYDGATLLVPGLPEADEEDAAIAAYERFVGTVERRLAGESGWGPR